ncbi:MAG TPA: hypothetical protein VME20_05375 [Acidimicrobiales bacterium]|nr:hypothetical protein [Acidimicrobiales bacterium]
MSWDWAGLLVLGAACAGSLAWLTNLSRKEAQRLRVVRAEVARARRRRVTHR